MALVATSSLASPRVDWKDIVVDDVLQRPPGVAPVLELRGDNVHNVSAIQLHVTNFGLLGSLPGTNYPYAGAPSAQSPPGSGIEYLFGGGLWVGARVRDLARVSGLVHQRDRMQFEFRPGLSAADRIYHAYERITNGARIPELNADDDGDGAADEDPLDGHDNDSDGAVDEDFAAISSQMFTCSYRDDDPNIRLAEPDHIPLGIEVRQSTLAWEGDEARDLIGLEFTITNHGMDPMDSVYVAFYADFDIGSRARPGVAQDDLMGFWEGKRRAPADWSNRTIKVSIGYAYDDDTDEGTAPGWIGLQFLGAVRPHDDGIVRPVRARNFRMFAGTAAFAQGGDPTNDDERYALMAGGGPRAIVPPESLGLRPAVAARFPDDYRSVISAGPFGTLQPGESLTIAAALVTGNGFDALIDHAVTAQLIYDGKWLNCDRNPSTGIDGRETPRCAPAWAGCIPYSPCDPDCPSNCINSDCASFPRGGCVWQDADCDVELETGDPTGVEGRECHATWMGRATPSVPPPLRLVPHEDRVEVYWRDDGASPADTLLGSLRLESFSVWRADGWDRPIGTSQQTGPAAHLWSLLGEYSVVDRTGAGSGLETLRYVPRLPSNLLEFYRTWQSEHPGLPAPDLPGYSAADCDTARALVGGAVYYMFVDPPFLHGSPDGGACPASGACAPLVVGGTLRPARCDASGRCHATLPPPHPGMHLFYAVTRTENGWVFRNDGTPDSVPGISGRPSGNFAYTRMPTTALAPARAGDAENEIYAVPNPVTRETLQPWQLQPNNNDPTGIKVEFHHLPQSLGKLTIWTLAGDRVRDLPFDARSGNGTVVWDLVTRNGQDVTSGVYLFTVEAEDPAFKRFIGKLVVIR